MKLAATLLCAVLLSSGFAQAPDGNTLRLRYQRDVLLPANTNGEACAVLDATVYAHTASRSADDLRLFRSTSHVTAAETPFLLTESEAQPGETDNARILNIKLHNGSSIGFDLVMPSRPYSRVNLQLAAKDFYGIATVMGSNPHTGRPVYLGSFAVFDLTSRHLARSTTLPLSESTFPQLHIELQLSRLPRGPYPNLTAAILEDATIPPTRESQTLFTTVAASLNAAQQGSRTIATLRVPEHVPVERIAVKLPPNDDEDFLRPITIMAKPVNAQAKADDESITSEISTVSLQLSLDANREPAPVRNLNVDATLAANLRSDATVEIAIENGDKKPLPIQSVQLQMRQRNLCFHAEPGVQYILRYGDKALRPPVYDSAQVITTPVLATLGPEQINPAYLEDTGAKPYTETHPEFLWIALLVAFATLGAALRHRLKHRQRRT